MIKLMVFIDGTWLYSNLRHLAAESNQPNFHIDYGALPKSIKATLEQRDELKNVDLVRTLLFGSYPVNYDPADEERARKRNDFFSMLREDHHYEIEAFPIDYQQRRILHDDRGIDDDFYPKEKCVDVALASAMLYYAALPGAFDIAAAVVGDKDYIPLFKRVRRLGKRIAVASIRQSCAKIYIDRYDDTGLKDFQIIWLNDLLEKIVWRPEESIVECQSPLHEGARGVTTTMRLREGQPFFCDQCRTRFAQQKEEQLHEYISAGLDIDHDFSGHEALKVCDGVIESLIPDRGFGFLKRDDGASFFFHLTNVTNAEWKSVKTGVKARFTVTKEPIEQKAGAASDVALLFDKENSVGVEKSDEKE